MLHLYHGILHRTNKEQITDIYYNAHEFFKHYFQQMKVNIKDSTPCNSIYMKFKIRQNKNIKIEVRMVVTYGAVMAQKVNKISSVVLKMYIWIWLEQYI